MKKRNGVLFILSPILGKKTEDQLLVSKDDHFSLSRQWTKNLSHKKNFKVTRRTVWLQQVEEEDHHQFSEILIISSSKSSCGLSKIPRPKNNMTTKKTLQNNFCLCAVPIQKIPEILLINSVRDSGFSA